MSVSGLWVISATAEHLGTIKVPMHPHNLAWGDDDHSTLYLAARSGIYRIRVDSRVPAFRSRSAQGVGSLGHPAAEHRYKSTCTARL